MNAQRQIQQTGPIPTEQLNELIIDSIQDLKGKNILKLDLRHLHDAPADFFIICEGDSDTQVRAISDSVSEKVYEKQSLKPTHIEGRGKAHWVLIDYFDTVVHVFHPQYRNFYELEDMWSDAHSTEYSNL